LDTSGIFFCFNEFLCTYQKEIKVELCVPLKQFLKIQSKYLIVTKFIQKVY
jgi:hypothetical protein